MDVHSLYLLKIEHSSTTSRSYLDKNAYYKNNLMTDEDGNDLDIANGDLGKYARVVVSILCSIILKEGGEEERI